MFEKICIIKKTLKGIFPYERYAECDRNKIIFYLYNNSMQFAKKNYGKIGFSFHTNGDICANNMIRKRVIANLNSDQCEEVIKKIIKAINYSLNIDIALVLAMQYYNDIVNNLHSSNITSVSDGTNKENIDDDKDNADAQTDKSDSVKVEQPKKNDASDKDFTNKPQIETLTFPAEIYVSQKAREKMMAHIYRCPEKECGGLLIGNIGKDAVTGVWIGRIDDVYYEKELLYNYCHCLYKWQTSHWQHL